MSRTANGRGGDGRAGRPVRAATGAADGPGSERGAREGAATAAELGEFGVIERLIPVGAVGAVLVVAGAE